MKLKERGNSLVQKHKKDQNDFTSLLYPSHPEQYEIVEAKQGINR